MDAIYGVDELSFSDLERSLGIATGFPDYQQMIRSIFQ